MSERSPQANPVSEPEGSAPDDLDESIFETIGNKLAEPTIDNIAGGPSSPKDVRRLRVSVRESVRETLNKLVGELGEGWIGGPPDPAADLESHVIGELKQTAKDQQTILVDKLLKWSDELGAPQSESGKSLPPVPRSHFFLYLWWESFLLWDRALAYRTVHVLSAATAKFAGPAVPLPAGQPSVDGERARSWEELAWRAACRAMALIEADSWAFRQISLSDAASLVDAAGRTAKKAAEIGEEVRAVRDALDDNPEPDDVLTWRGLRFLAAEARETEIFYATLASLAKTVTDFERWLASPHRPGIQPERPARPTRRLGSHDELLKSVNASLELLYDVQIHQLKGRYLAECEPWEQLLVEMRQIITSANEVFIPRRVWLRYCFPFAVDFPRTVEEAEHGRWVNLLKSANQATLTEQLREKFKGAPVHAVGGNWMTVNEPEDLTQTLFFRASDADDDLFGGIRVGLSELEFTGDWWPGSGGKAVGYRCRVWLDLNQMGVLCLCVEPIEPMEFPPPHVLFRALRAGSPFAVGEEVSLVGQPSGGPSHEMPAWDNLDAFARDIIRYAASALYVTKKRRRSAAQEGPHDGSPMVRYLNSHLVAVVQTDGQFKTQSGDIAQPLDSAVGGRVLLRPIHRALSTLEEWVRLPPQSHAERRVHDVVAGVLPEIGYSGDWFVHTGEMSIFGIVATPPWMREVYPEAAQFANSWSPLLRMWNRRLQDAIRDLRQNPARSGKELRQVEQWVRRSLAQINSEELCSTLTNRRFLDELLDAAGVGRLQNELETHLESAEQLTDWYNTNEQQRSATRRDVWLFIIALLGIFSLGDFMLLANATHLHGRFLFLNLTYNGKWEDWFILIFFLVALIVGSLFALGWYKRLSNGLRVIRSKVKRGKLAATR